MRPSRPFSLSLPGRERGGSVRATSVTRLALVTVVAVLVATIGAQPVAAGQEDRQEALRSAALEHDRPLGSPRPRELHVMSLNVLYESTFVNFKPSWSARRPALRGVLKRARPHLIGTQEATERQVDHISSDLGKHYRKVVRTPAGTSWALAVFYDKRRLRPLESGLIALPSRRMLFGACCRRAALWTRFVDKKTGHRFVHVNTHLEAFSADARAESARILRQRVERIARRKPIVLTGDFNEPARAGRPVYVHLVRSRWVRDSWRAARVRTNRVGTYHNYRGLKQNGSRIDWILTSPQIRVRRAAINISSRDGLFPSDHFPVQALIRLPRR